MTAELVHDLQVWSDPAAWWRPLAEAAVACVGGGGTVGGGGYGNEAVPDGPLWFVAFLCCALELQSTTW